jgi:hypothetical protein
MKDYFRKFLGSSAKPTLHIVLLLIFLFFFGLPSINRFNAKEVITVTSKKLTGGISAPAISLVALNPRTKVGWRDDTATYPRVMQHICGNNASCAKLGN